MWQKIPPPLYKHPIWGPILGLWFGAWCIGSYWYYLTAPSGDLLVLHERGLRYGRHLIPFDQLARIRPGMSEARIVDWVNRMTGSANKPRIMIFKGDRLAERVRQASVTLEFRESRPLALRSLLVKHDADDLGCFFSTIATQHPELIDDRDLSLLKNSLAK